MEQWILVWALLTPGGDIIDRGVGQFGNREACNYARRLVEQRSFPMGQKIQAICLQRI